MVRVRVKPILFNIYINSYVSELECFARMKASEPGGVLYELHAPSPAGHVVGNDIIVYDQLSMIVMLPKPIFIGCNGWWIYYLRS